MQVAAPLPVQERCRRHNANPVKGIEHQQIAIPGDDRVRIAVYGRFEEFVIARVAAHANSSSHRNHRALLRIFFNGCLSQLPSKMFVEFFEKQHGAELGERFFRGEKDGVGACF